ncbi:MAG: glutathione S-transferase family protein [Gammaproteobacteria bacterium]|nr:glutathione S-transferase family protein [Gammaproteobacteria bacterium]
MLKIHHVKGTRGFRPIWFCEERGLPYEIEVIDFSPEFRSKAEWRALSPTGKVPVMTDGHLTMFESGAMVDYLVERYGGGNLVPEPGTADSALCRQWCWFGESTFARPVGETSNHHRIAPERGTVPFVLEDGWARMRLCLDTLEGALADADYLVANTFGIADIMTGYTLALASHRGMVSDDHPNCRAYVARLSERPAYQAARAAG